MTDTHVDNDDAASYDGRNGGRVNGSYDGRNGRRVKPATVRRVSLSTMVRSDDLSALRKRLSELHNLAGRPAPKEAMEEAVEWIFHAGVEAFLAKMADVKPVNPLEGLR